MSVGWTVAVNVKSTQTFDCFYTGQSPFVLNCQTVFAQVRSKTKQNKEKEKKNEQKKAHSNICSNK